MTLRALVLVPVVTLLFTGPVFAQERGAWRFGAGAGAALVLSGHDLQDTGDAGVAVRLSAQRSRAGGGGPAWGVEWIGAWLQGAPGGDHRHHVGVTLATAPRDGALGLRAGLGLGLVTVADAELPLPGGPPGDAVVGIGDYGVPSVSGGVEARVAVGRSLGLVPAADVLFQRAGGLTLGLAVLSVRLETRRR